MEFSEMAPCKPRTFTAGQDPLTKFDGAISVRNLPRPPDRLFLFHGIMRPSRGIYAKLIATGQKPPHTFPPVPMGILPRSSREPYY
ncbi:hypothetical protein N7519_000049 [Penicillium mononematosum]|uniref:uncharacterized protein n=1 Tax=Penicillium mononematosum TaxID=268346 RepID=UPI0025499F10|nr:uncharacterized protein N7519_000049 [Penicillium mononematosum]KAJ6190028.1 hypothetical protein N7519_000049 [Penicillium mononematosum]